MAKYLRKIITIVLTAAMILCVTSCGGTTDTGTTANTNTPAATDAGNKTPAAGESTEVEEPKQGIDTSEFQEMTFVTMGDTPTNGRMEAAMEKLNAIFKERINATMKLQYVEWADWQTQYNLLLASGDSSLDLIGTATDWLNAWENVKKGSFKVLTEDMLKTYAPNTWSAVTPNHWDQCKYNGKIYFIPEDQYTQWTNHGFFYRGDWAKEAGLEKISSFEDMEKYMDGVLKNHKGVIPWDVAGSANLPMPQYYINAYTKLTTLLGTATGNYSLFFIDPAAPYTVANPFFEGSTLDDFAVMMKRWSDKGFWREDALNYTGVTRDLFYAGKTAVDQHHTQTYIYAIRQNMDEKQPGSDAKFYPFSETSRNLVKDIITHGACAIGFNSKHAERALMAYDLIRNDQECYRLFTLGTEGTDYIVKEGGMFGRPAGFDDAKDGLGTDFWWGRNDSLELINEKIYGGYKDLFKEFNSYAVEYPITKFVFDPAKVQTQIAAVSEVCASYIPKLSLGKVKDPKAEVEAFRKALKDANYDQISYEIQAQLTAFKASEGK
jgi:ABC-type glycerol-3-phosphate transport system substrate-binding protein